MNLDTVLQGLAITVVGMGLVFLALGLIVLAMVLMGRLLRPRPAGRDGTPQPGTPQPGAGSSERARVAAMVAAIVMAEADAQSSSPGAWDLARPEDVPSPWQASHRSRALSRHS